MLAGAFGVHLPPKQQHRACTRSIVPAKAACRGWRAHAEAGEQEQHVQREAAASLAVSGQQVLAYAELAVRNAAKRTRPVSKQENLGPRRIQRCGWGGGPPPLEVISQSLRQQRIAAEQAGM